MSHNQGPLVLLEDLKGDTRKFNTFFFRWICVTVIDDYMNLGFEFCIFRNKKCSYFILLEQQQKHNLLIENLLFMQVHSIKMWFYWRYIRLIFTDPWCKLCCNNVTFIEIISFPGILNDQWKNINKEELFSNLKFINNVWGCIVIKSYLVKACNLGYWDKETLISVQNKQSILDSK